MEDTSHKAIAIVGLSAIMPDAPDAATFWKNITGGRYSITDVPEGRWDPALYYDADHHAPEKTYSKIGGWVKSAPWDPAAWKLPIPPRVAEAMDEGQRWAIACARALLADFGYPERPLDLERTAVVLGNAMAGEKHYLTALRISFPEYERWLSQATAFRELPREVREAIAAQFHERVTADLPPITEDTMPGELANCIAGRIANTFNLHGPNFTCDAACASALAAISAAREGLIEGDFDAVITGGLDRNMGASTFVKFSKIGALSATGTRPFADGADGFVMGEGAALFLLKRLADAEAAGDKIYAVIRGMAGSSDGKGKGITAPNPIGQQLAVRRAWKDAGVAPTEGLLVEAHGTSTPVGDVVEVRSLMESLGGSFKKQSIALGSVKSNIGHLKGAAGAAGLLKAAMSLHEKVLPASLNWKRPNPAIEWESSPFRVNTETRPWESGDVRRAAVSAFGFGGTNFHVVLEEYQPGRIRASTTPRGGARSATATTSAAAASAKAPLRGALLVGGDGPGALRERLARVRAEAEAGHAPAPSAPRRADLDAKDRVAIDYGDAAELAKKIAKAEKALESDNPAAWKALRAQGIFRGQGPRSKVAFLFTGQGSQYVNMLRGLRDQESIVQERFAEADRVMTPALGRSLTSHIFVDGADKAKVEAAEASLRETAITQPAVLAVDLSLFQLLGAYGVRPDMVMGHSLGEYAALVAAGGLPFEDALSAVSARGREMSRVSVSDRGKMAAVMGPLPEIEKRLRDVTDYVIIANVNSKSQVVIGGSTKGVEEASAKLVEAGFQVIPLSVSHAFHTSIVAPASEPLRTELGRLRLTPPTTPIVANTTGDFYAAADAAGMIDVLAAQVASPVQFLTGLETLYGAGARVFVEVGPKKALAGFADDVLGGRTDVLALFTNHPKLSDAEAFNQALCGLYSRGFGEAAPEATAVARSTNGVTAPAVPAVSSPMKVDAAVAPPIAISDLAADPYADLGRKVVDLVRRAGHGGGARPRLLVTGAALGLPGAPHVFDDANVGRILHGEQLIDVIPVKLRHQIVDKHITRLVKKEGQDPVFETIENESDVIKLAGRAGRFDLVEEYGVPAERVEAFDRATCLAFGAGLDALRDAGIPLVPRYKTTSKGTYLPDGWALPEAMRDDTGVVFASAFPGYNALISELGHFADDHALRGRLAELQGLKEKLHPTGEAAAELDRRIHDVEHELAAKAYAFDRRFLFRVLAMGHSQFAEFIRARGPNTQVNAACASTTQALSVAQDWIACGRCKRVIILGADDITSDDGLGWFGTGFLASGAAATEDVVEEVATPFDRRRHGMVVGMGAAALVIESEDAARARGIAGICEVMSSVTANSAFHGTRLDVDHIARIMESLVREAEERYGISRERMAEAMVFVSHETYTPARGGSAAAEIFALRRVFGAAAERIVIANTKGFTGHAMGAGIEDVVAVKALETGIVPPVPNLKEPDPDLGNLNLSKGGVYATEYALRLAAGFGSQVAMSLSRRTMSGPRPAIDDLGFAHRVEDKAAFAGALAGWTGYASPKLEVVHRTLRVKDEGPPQARPTAPRLEAPVATPRAPAPAPAKPAPSPAPAAAAPPPAAAPAAKADDIEERVLALVAEKTGYPRDMLALDLDLEADLGVDTVKQADVFATIRAAYGIPRDDQLKLRDYPTLAHVIGFVRDRTGAPAAPAPAPAAAAAVAAATPDEIEDRVLALVAEKTGYPRDMLALDLDLEADLGVDTVKQADVFATIRAAYGIPRDDQLKLRDYPTLAHVIGFVRARTGAPAAPAAAPAPAAAVAATPDEIEDRVLALVAEKTGYPRDMLALDLDLEADLGVDTVKQADVFATIRAAYGIPRDDQLKLRDYPTLAHVIGFVRARTGARAPEATAPATTDGAPAAAPATTTITRRVPVAVLRPSLELCKPTGVSLEGRRVVLVADGSGTAPVLTAVLAAHGAAVVHVEPPSSLDGDRMREAIEGALAAGRVDGVYWLPALDAERPLAEMTPSEWTAAVFRRVKLAYETARAVYTSLAEPGAFFVSATRMGGQHGYGASGASCPLGGGVSGFTKALGRERPSALVKCVDFEVEASATSIANALVDETLRDPGAVEVGHRAGLRWGVGLDEVPLAPVDRAWARGKVFVVTGAAGSITSAITADLAATSRGTFYLLDRVPAPTGDGRDAERVETDRDGLKRDLFERLKASGARATPAMVEKDLAVLERELAARRAIRAVEAAGGRAEYRSVDLLDAEAVRRVMDEIRADVGHIDALVHAAGLEISRSLPDKSRAEFDLVFDVKATGFYNLLHAAGGMPVGAVVAFSSVAGRFGNVGQTDYSAANDLLCKILSSFRASRPATRGIAIDWTAWSGIGMAARGSIPELMKLAGVEMLPPEVGVPVTLRELASGDATEIVVAGALGAMAKGRDEIGGALVGPLGGPPRPMPWTLRSIGPEGELVVEATVDPAAHGFLHDHAIDGTPVLPGVMGVESFAEVASALVPGFFVESIQDVRFHAAFKFFRDEPRTITVTVRVREDGDGRLLAECSLIGVRPLPNQADQRTTHFTGRVRLTRTPLLESTASVPPPGRGIDADDIYRVYFHGPAYRVLASAWGGGGAAAARLAARLPPNHTPESARTISAPRLVEACFQTAGFLEIGTTGKMGLPAEVDAIEVMRPLEDVSERALFAVTTARDGGYDASVVDEAGTVYVAVRGYRTGAARMAVDPSGAAPFVHALEASP